MKAVYVANQGGIESLTYGDLPVPQPAPDEVLVRVRAAGVNRRDIFEREGSHGLRIEGMKVPGLDMAGEIEGVGEYVAHLGHFKRGDRILSGGYTSGTYAEYSTAHMNNVHKIPDWLSYEEAAAIPTVYCAAYQAMVVRAHMTAGEDVLVMAAGSGVGSAGIQLAKAFGCRVLTTAGSDAKLAEAKEIGADVGINYREIPEFSAEVLKYTGGRGVDLVYEHIGATVFEQCYRSLKRGGRLVTNGVTAGHIVELHLGRLWTRELSLIGATMHPDRDLPAVMNLVERRLVRSVLDRTFPLEDAAEAHRVLESNDFFGKLVLVP